MPVYLTSRTSLSHPNVGHCFAAAKRQNEVMIPSGVRAVVFDAVGTLIHPDPPASVVYADVGRRYGSRRSEEHIRRRFLKAFHEQEEIDRQKGWHTSEHRERERWRSIVSAALDDVDAADECLAELLAHFGRPSAWRCDSHVRSVFSSLATRGLALAIASNYDGRLRGAISELPGLAHVSHLAISSEIGWRKPAPEFFKAVCRQLGLTPQSVLHVGDDLQNDYNGARAAGLHAVLFAPDIGSDEDTIRIAALTDLLKA